MLHKFRQKPEHQKKKIAVVTSLFITAIIFVFWISTTLHSFAVLGAESIDVSGASSKVSESPFALVKENLASVYGSLTKDVTEVKKQVLGE